MAAGADLVHLIDLSLGVQPSGVVNFNSLHGLMHEIVRRLVHMEELQSMSAPSLPQFETRLWSPARGGEDATDSAVDRGKEKPPPQLVAPTTSSQQGDKAQSAPPGPAFGDSGEKKTEAPPSESVETEGGKAQSLTSGPALLGEEKAQAQPSTTKVQPSPSHATSGSSVSRPGSRARSHTSIVSAANDISALERKISSLETKVDTLQSLPEMLERMKSDSNATPIRDMWNFTNLSKRISSAEEGLDKNSRLMDELVGEIQALRQSIDELRSGAADSHNWMDAMSKSMKELEEKLKELESLRLASADDSPGEAFAALVGELQKRCNALQEDSKATKEKVDAIESQLEKQSEMLNERLETLQQQQQSQSDEFTKKLGEIVEGLEQFSSQLKNLESMLAEKVSATDLASLMPQSTGSDEAASLMPKLVMIQNKLNQFEAQMDKLSSLPSDAAERLLSMQATIDQLSAELDKLNSLVAAGLDAGRLEELGSQLAQLRERMGEVDRAVDALTAALSQRQAAPDADEEEGASQFVDQESFALLQNMVNELSQEQERILGTTANLSHEVEVNQEHVKNLYKTADQLERIKADKDVVALEVGEKADRAALSGMADREWVDSTFEKLDKQIRDAKAMLLGQEESFKSSMNQINEDVECKLDRMELQPLKDYFEKRLTKLKASQTMAQQEALGDDAAGVHKPLRFRCISCDKPVGLKPREAIPALPSIQNLPGTRTLRPYTTYELELIRRQQKIGQVIPIFPPTLRSVGGAHTLTRPHQKIRISPHSAGSYSGEMAHHRAVIGPSVLDEVDILGQDGHIYKGRASRLLPPVRKPRSGGASRSKALHFSRPSTSPLQYSQSVTT